MLRESARQEFEAARFEDDPEIVRRGVVSSTARLSGWLGLWRWMPGQARLQSCGSIHGTGGGEG